MATERNILGVRVRERRRQVGLTQAELARRVGISASYLNLIEHNKRRVAGGLLRRLGAALGLSTEELDGAAERRLADALQEIAAIPAVEGLGVEAGAAGELIGRFPGWARALAALARSEREATALARALGDRLAHDTFLGETVHRMLSRVSAIRSASEILVDVPDVPAADQTRFQRMIHEEARALSDIGEALAAYFDRIGETERSLTPVDEVEALFEANGNRFAAIEAAAEDLFPRLVQPAPTARRAEAEALVDGELAAALDALLAGLETAPARARARAALRAYAVGAVLAPMSVFARSAAEAAYDVEALAAAVALNVETVWRRLTALSPEEGAPQFGYFRANAAGTIIELLALPGLAVPRYAAACPLWILYRAQQTPGAILRQRALFPSGDRFVFVARARAAGPTGFGRPRHYVTDMLAMREADAMRTVYAPDAATPMEPVGPACRLCARKDCPQRVEDPLGE